MRRFSSGSIRPLSVQVVDLEGQTELVARAAKHQPAYGCHELLTTDPAVAVAIQNRQHALCQKFAANAQCALQIGRINQLVSPGVTRERVRHRLEQPRIE